MHVRQRDERGAVAVIVALVLAPILLGVSAIVVDLGALYADRRQQQTAADASSLAVAQDCAVVRISCTGKRGTPAVIAQDYASGGNGVPGSSYSGGRLSSSVDYLCGSAPGLSACSTAQLAQCTGPVPAFPYVQTGTSSADAAGTKTLLPNKFAQFLAGDETGRQTRACARTAYGPVKVAPSLAVTISYCEWNSFTSGGTSYVSPPPYDVKPPASVDRVLLLHGTKASCGGGAAGWDLPGGFGWLDDDGGCTALVNIDQYETDPGASSSQDCRDRLAVLAQYPPDEPIYLPIYDGFSGTGNGGTYHLKGFAAFVLTGYSLPGMRQQSWLTGKYPCNGQDKCLSGFFTKGLVPGGGALGGVYMGAASVQLVN